MSGVESEWGEAFEDARTQLNNQLDSIEDLNTRAYQILRLNAVILTIISAALYNTSPSLVAIIWVVVGIIGLIVCSHKCLRLMGTSRVASGLRAESFEHVNNSSVEFDEYFRHAIGNVYPKAIREAQNIAKNQAEALNWVYYWEGRSIIWLLGGAILRLLKPGLAEAITIIETVM